MPKSGRMSRFLPLWPRAARILLSACTLTLAVVLPAACAGGPLLAVDGPLPRLDPAPAEPATGVVAHLPKEWMLYSQPPATYGVPVLSASGGTEWEVTGRWSTEPDTLDGQQYWVLMAPVWDWYRLSGAVEPWGHVALWGQLPGEWLEGDPGAVPAVEPPWGEPWRTVPYSRGHVLAASGDGQPALHACPDTACPVLERPARDQAVPVTGQFTDGGRLWYRVEFRQQVLWAEASSGRLTVAWAGRLRRGGAETAGYRSCEPVVMFPPPPHTLCPVNGDGRFLDLFEREYDRLDPVFGRLPRPEQGKAEAAAPVAPAVSETEAAARRVDYRAPGTHPHEPPGLDYHFGPVVFSDESTTGDWAVADMDACDDALRAPGRPAGTIWLAACGDHPVGSLR